LADTFVDKNKFRYDMGPHEFCTENERIVKLLKNLLKNDFLILHKNASQYFFNKYIPYPLKPIDFITQIPPTLAVKVFFEVINSRFKDLSSIGANYSFKSWVESRFGKTMYTTYFKPYTEKVWGIPSDELDPRTASSRISFDSVFDLLFKTLKHYITRRDDFSTIHNPLKDSFYYAKGGIGKICQRLYEECLKFGVEFKFDYEVEKIVKKNARVINIKFSNGKKISGFDYVINTIPLTILTKALDHNHDYPLRFRSMILGFFSFDKPKLSDYHWIYAPSRDICFIRVTEFNHLKNAGMAPEGKTCIALELTCFKEDRIWNSGDKEIIGLMRKDLMKMGLIKGNEKYDAKIVKQEYSYPLQVIGFLEMVEDIVKEVIKPIENLVTIGRQGLYKYCNMNECMEMAFDAVNQIENNTKSFNYKFESKWRGYGLKEERILKN
jgi:protoporphyrinogen oxidase